MSNTQLCSACNYSVHKNSRALFCDICQSWVHQKCTRLSVHDYRLIFSSDDPWFCQSCLSELFPFTHIADEVDFHFALFNAYSNYDMNLDYDLFNSFNPFVSDPDTRHLLNNSDIDPNSNIFFTNSQILSNCAYYTTR